MAPNKLEKQFRELLKSREIKPSAQAWERLDAMLTATTSGSVDLNKKIIKKKFPWFMVAAIFTGFVIVGTIFFTTNALKPAINNIDSNVVIINNHKMPNINNQDSKKNVISSSESLTNSNVIIIANKNRNNVTANVSNKTIYKNQNYNNGVSIIKNNQNQVFSTTTNKYEIKPNEITKQDFNLNEQQVAISQAIYSNQVIEYNLSTNIGAIKAVKIDANSLLSEVDKEITNEYRETVFQKIGKNFQAVRVAFAERNYRK